MQYDKIALFTDLDGTLLNSRREVSAENLGAIAHFVAEGGLFGISTGRAPVNALDVLPPLPINTWSVVLNGAEGYHFPSGTAANVRCLPKQVIEPLIRQILLAQPQINVQVCTPDRLLFLSDPALADRDFVETHQPLDFVSVDRALEFPWVKVLLCGPREMLEDVVRCAERTGLGEQTTVVFSQYTYLEILPKNTDKGSCLHALRQQESLQGRTIIAIGDYSNDIGLLREADVGVAVGNALPEVKAVADAITGTNDEHALADLIERVIPPL